MMLGEFVDDYTVKVVDVFAMPQAAVVEELKLSPEELAVARVGKLDAKKHLEADVAALMALNINQSLGTMLDTVVFRAE